MEKKSRITRPVFIAMAAFMMLAAIQQTSGYWATEAGGNETSNSIRAQNTTSTYKNYSFIQYNDSIKENSTKSSSITMPSNASKARISNSSKDYGRVESSNYTINSTRSSNESSVSSTAPTPGKLAPDILPKAEQSWQNTTENATFDSATVQMSQPTTVATRSPEPMGYADSNSTLLSEEAMSIPGGRQGIPAILVSQDTLESAKINETAQKKEQKTYQPEQVNQQDKKEKTTEPKPREEKQNTLSVAESIKSFFKRLFG